MKFLKRWWKRARISYKRLLRSPDSSKRIAQGIALGVALDFLPIPIIDIPISYVLARLLKINAPAATLTVVFLKWAVPFFFLANYCTGSLMLGVPASALPPSHLPWHQYSLVMIQSVGYPLILGSVTNAAAAWVVAYLALRRLLELYRNRPTR